MKPLTAVTCRVRARNLLEDPWAEPSQDMFTRSVSPEQAPDKATYLNIDFERGDPVALDGEQLSPATLLARLNKVRARNGPAQPNRAVQECAVRAMTGIRAVSHILLLAVECQSTCLLRCVPSLGVTKVIIQHTSIQPQWVPQCLSCRQAALLVPCMHVA